MAKGRGWMPQAAGGCISGGQGMGKVSYVTRHLSREKKINGTSPTRRKIPVSIPGG